MSVFHSKLQVDLFRIEVFMSVPYVYTIEKKNDF